MTLMSNMRDNCQRDRMHVFAYASCATQGARNYQEDMAKVLADGQAKPATAKDQTLSDDHKSAVSQLIAVLADGMGGHAGGDLASRMVCETFLGSFTQKNNTTGPKNSPDNNSETRQESDVGLLCSVPERLLNALNESNEALAKRVKSEPMLTGMGTTLIGVSFAAHGVHWVSVGDSPLMLYRRGEIAHLNEDHSLAPELDRLAQAGQISFEEARSDPRRHMLRSAVTGDDLDLIDHSRKALELATGDYVILASDGVHALEENEIERIITAYSDDGTQAVANALIRAVEAVRDPHQDNATVVVVRVMQAMEEAG